MDRTRRPGQADNAPKMRPCRRSIYQTLHHRRGLTFHIADRKPLLVGIFVDDRRDSAVHSTYLAEQGEIVKNDEASFLVLQGGTIQRLEAGQRDSRIVTFDRYPFDLSQFTGGPQNVVYTVREKYLWELLWPRSDDAPCGAAGSISIEAARPAGHAALDPRSDC
jgi:lipopolysaccharide export LptBFGC system permease protein LptF